MCRLCDPSEILKKHREWSMERRNVAGDGNGEVDTRLSLVSIRKILYFISGATESHQKTVNGGDIGLDLGFKKYSQLQVAKGFEAGRAENNVRTRSEKVDRGQREADRLEKYVSYKQPDLTGGVRNGKL